MLIGLYGKLPSHGDFLRRRIEDAFIGVWDAWLQECIAASQAALGERWLDVYLTSPAWRFVCDAGVCGSRAWSGVIVPSVDRVGRYFPLTVVWEIPQGVTPFSVAARADGWFDAVERLAVETLAAEQVDLDQFDERLLELGADLDLIDWSSAVALDLASAAAVTETSAYWRLPTASPAAFDALAEQLLYARLSTVYRPMSLFWTEGSAIIEPSCLLLRGLPEPAAFTSLLDGSWSTLGWRTVPAKVAEMASHADTLVNDSASLGYASAGITDIGHVRQTNQDAFIERTEIGVWCVADGMGGHSDGDVASRMVCDAIAELMPAPTLELTVEDVRRRLQAVNKQLYRAATRPVNPVQSGTTVVAIVVRGAHSAVLWAGDSRAYRLRDGKLQQLTTDHVATIERGEIVQHAISRAVGGDPVLALDIHYDPVRPGDRLLLCSDGLTHELQDDRIHDCLREPDTRKCARQLIDAALASGGSDNVSVIVVDANDISAHQCPSAPC